jgi:hypothetical protein
MINAFKAVYDHWESIKKAFQTDGIIGGLKRLGIVLMDALLKPLQQILDLASNFANISFFSFSFCAILPFLIALICPHAVLLCILKHDISISPQLAGYRLCLSIIKSVMSLYTLLINVLVSFLNSASL